MGNIDRYYRLLGIPSSASLDDIKKAFLEMEQGLQLNFESQDPEERKQAGEKLREIYEAHEQVVKHYLEHGPPNIQGGVKEAVSVREAPLPVAAKEHHGGPTEQSPLPEEPAEEETTQAPVSWSDKLLSNKTLFRTLILAFTILLAIAVGSLIGIVVFRKTAQQAPPPQPIPQTDMTPVTPFQSMSAAVTSGNQPGSPAEMDEIRIPGDKRQQKKPVKAKKQKASKAPARISRESLEKIMNAAAEGDAEAQYRLGTFYSRGVGVKKDTAEAMKWYRRAASRGHAKARENLEYVYE